jgi:hypothetical protein
MALAMFVALMLCASSHDDQLIALWESPLEELAVDAMQRRPQLDWQGELRRRSSECRVDHGLAHASHAAASIRDCDCLVPLVANSASPSVSAC